MEESVDVDVSENSGFSPQIIQSSILIGFSIIFTIHFGVSRIFGNTHVHLASYQRI